MEELQQDHETKQSNFGLPVIIDDRIINGHKVRVIFNKFPEDTFFHLRVFVLDWQTVDQTQLDALKLDAMRFIHNNTNLRLPWLDNGLFYEFKGSGSFAPEHY